MDDKTMEWIKELYQKNLELELKVKELEWKIEQLNREDNKGWMSIGHSQPIFSGASQISTGCSTRDSWGVSGYSTCFGRSIGISRPGISQSEGVASSTGSDSVCGTSRGISIS